MSAPSTPHREVQPLPERTPLPPARRNSSRFWPYLAAIGIGVAAWTAQAAVWLSGPLTEAREEVVGAALFADLVLGVVMLAVLPLRHRHPLAVACVSTAGSAGSVAALGAAALAVGSMSTRRRRKWVAAVAGVFLPGWVVSEVLYRSRFAPAEESIYETAFGLLLGALFFAAVVARGYYVGARRELVGALHERVSAVEREQTLTAQAARDAERTRIAREMHDVLAHRISLVAMHAGAITYREDLSRAQTTEAAEIIQLNAQLALTELRQVLGVLRPDPGADGVEQPQPTLAELPALLADAREAGSQVELAPAEPSDGAGLDLARLPETLSRTSFRIVQEALTNARKHAPGEPVRLRIAGAPGTHLELEVRNPVAARPGGEPRPSGVGLVGLAERVDLAGGALEHGVQPDGSFVVRARLPWPT